MNEAFLDLLDSLETLGPSSSMQLADDTGRTIKACRYRLPELAGLGLARRAGRIRRARRGQPQIVWELTPAGAVALVDARVELER